MSEHISNRENTTAMLHNLEDIPDSLSSSPENLANLINRAFLAPMINFNPDQLRSKKNYMIFALPNSLCLRN